MTRQELNEIPSNEWCVRGTKKTYDDLEDCDVVCDTVLTFHGVQNVAQASAISRRLYENGYYVEIVAAVDDYEE